MAEGGTRPEDRKEVELRRSAKILSTSGDGHDQGVGDAEREPGRGA